MGAKFSAAKPLVPKLESHKLDQKYTQKWVCPKYMYNGKSYPSMLSGSGYVMSRSTAICLYKEALEMPFFHLEDVFVTGFAAENCDIPRIGHNGFRHLPVKAVRKSDIMLHYRDISAKQKIHRKLGY